MCVGHLVTKCFLPWWRWNRLGVLVVIRWCIWTRLFGFALAFLFFFSLSSSIFIFAPSNFQSNPSICYSFRFGPYSFNYYFLFEIIYKIRILFQFHPLLFLYISDFVTILFITICFIWDNFFNWFFFTFPSSLTSFFNQVWSSSFGLLFFYFGNFFKLIFLFISSFNIKMDDTKITS